MATKQTVQLLMPEMGESVTEGTVLEWHVAEGDSVDEGQTVVEVSTDKVDAEVPAPAAGTVTKICVQVDDEVEVGKPLAEMEPRRRRPATEQRRQEKPGRGGARGRVERRRRDAEEPARATARRPRTTPRSPPAGRWRAAASRS